MKIEKSFFSHDMLKSVQFDPFDSKMTSISSELNIEKSLFQCPDQTMAMNYYHTLFQLKNTLQGPTPFLNRTSSRRATQTQELTRVNSFN